jgi:hypothetical protein
VPAIKFNLILMQVLQANQELEDKEAKEERVEILERLALVTEK